jgi:hypothetical protein
MGAQNFFAWLKKNASIAKSTHHWSQHPVYGRDLYVCPAGVRHRERPLEVCDGGEKRSPWYDAQCELLPPETVAQELDISYEASLSGRAFPEFDVTRHAFPYLDVRRGPAGSSAWIPASPAQPWSSSRWWSLRGSRSAG